MNVSWNEYLEDDMITTGQDNNHTKGRLRYGFGFLYIHQRQQGYDLFVKELLNTN